jgi:Zn-dependent protease
MAMCDVTLLLLYNTIGRLSIAFARIFCRGLDIFILSQHTIESPEVLTMLSSAFRLCSLVFAVILHELGHIAAARALGVRFCRLGLKRTGLSLITNEAGFPSYDDELICALGGPVAGALSALVARGIGSLLPCLLPFVQEFIPLSLALALLNLLPLHGFDGARILTCFLTCPHRHLPSLSPTDAARVVSLLSCLVLLLLWLLSVYLLLRRGSALSLYLFCLQLFRSLAMENGDTAGSFS